MIATAIAVIECNLDPGGILEVRRRRPEQSPLLVAATAEGQGQQQSLCLKAVETKGLFSVFPWIQRMLVYFVSAASQMFSAWQ